MILFYLYLCYYLRNVHPNVTLDRFFCFVHPGSSSWMCPLLIYSNDLAGREQWFGQGILFRFVCNFSSLVFACSNPGLHDLFKNATNFIVAQITSARCAMDSGPSIIPGVLAAVENLRLYSLDNLVDFHSRELIASGALCFCHAKNTNLIFELFVAKENRTNLHKACKDNSSVDRSS